MKILIIGASGFLGKKIFSVLSRNHEIAGTYHSKKNNNTHKILDISNRKDVVDLIEKIRPDIVIHTAAVVDSELCEKNKELAKKVNVEGTKNVVLACKKIGCKIVYISSDYIFDGENGPYKEDDKTGPVNYYGKTKLEGESLVKKHLEGHIIIRPAILYGYNDGGDKESFVTKVLKLLEGGEVVHADNKIIKYPTLTDDIAFTIKKLIESDKNGTFNLSSSEGLTRYQWAIEIAKVYGFDTKKVLEMDQKTLSKKPSNVKFDTSKIRRLGVKFTNVKNGLKIIKKQSGCMFRMIYSTRPDMLVLNQSASKFRIDVGKELAKEHPVKADVVIGVPESGIYAATGYASESKIPFYFGLIRDYYTRRTLFEPKAEYRSISLRNKLIVAPDVVKDKRIVLIDEAILSGATLKVVIEKINEVGVKEIHVRIPAPPMISQCKYKILSPDAHLIAKKFIKDGIDDKSLKNVIEREFGVKSLRFLSTERFMGVLLEKHKACIDCFKRSEK